MRKIRAFTLIEVLVVVAIIGMLVAIMMPSLREVRRVSRRTVCQKNLDQIGVGMYAYLTTNKDTFPYACRLPSYEPKVANDSDRRPYKPLYEVLKKELGKGNRIIQSKWMFDGSQHMAAVSANEVFCCPADQNTMARGGEVPPDEIIPADRYFDNEGTSYEWESQLNGEPVGFKLIRIYAKFQNKKFELAAVPKNVMWMMYDFEAFHGGPALRGSHNILYTDLHVESDKWESKKSVGKELSVIPAPNPF